MNRPICCGKPAKEYRKLYYWRKGFAHSIECGFRCMVCGAVRLPFNSDIAGYDKKRAADELVYQEGLAFDAKLAGANP